MKKRYYALIALITIPTVLGRLGVNPGGYAAPVTSSTIETPQTPSTTPRPIVTPTTSSTPIPPPERTPTPKATLSPADIERSRRLLRDFTERKQTSSTYGTSSNGGPTYDGQNVEPSVREFGDSSGMSWVDNYTFRADGPTPNTWGDVQK